MTKLVLAFMLVATAIMAVAGAILAPATLPQPTVQIEGLPVSMRSTPTSAIETPAVAANRQRLHEWSQAVLMEIVGDGHGLLPLALAAIAATTLVAWITWKMLDRLGEAIILLVGAVCIAFVALGKSTLSALDTARRWPERRPSR